MQFSSLLALFAGAIGLAIAGEHYFSEENGYQDADSRDVAPINDARSQQHTDMGGGGAVNRSVQNVDMGGGGAVN